MSARQVEVATANLQGYAYRQRFTAEQPSARDDFRSFQEILDEGEFSYLDLPEMMRNYSNQYAHLSNQQQMTTLSRSPARRLTNIRAQSWY